MLRTHFCSSSMCAGNGCSMNCAPRLSSQLIFRTASSLDLEALIGIKTQRLLRDAADRLHCRFVFIEAHFDLQHGIGLSFEYLLLRYLRGIDADGKGGNRRIGCIQSEIAIQRHAELLATQS